MYHTGSAKSWSLVATYLIACYGSMWQFWTAEGWFGEGNSRVLMWQLWKFLNVWILFKKYSEMLFQLTLSTGYRKQFQSSWMLSSRFQVWKNDKVCVLCCIIINFLSYEKDVCGVTGEMEIEKTNQNCFYKSDAFGYLDNRWFFLTNR